MYTQYINEVQSKNKVFNEILFEVGNCSWLCTDGEDISYFKYAQPDRSDCKGYLEMLSICEVDTKFD